MRGILERIKNGEVLIGDGATGTMLMEKNLLHVGECPEKLNLSHASALEELARLYVEAGADLVETNTFGASPLKLAAYGLEEQTEEINREGVIAVKRAVGDRAFVSASCGPTGKILQPFGDTEPDLVFKSFERQMRALLQESADVVCIETMLDLEEISLAIRAARAVSPTVPVIATMTFDMTPRGFFTMMGVSVEKACKRLEKEGANIIGSNCGNGIDNMIKIAAEFKKHTALPLIIQSNAGLPEVKDGKIHYTETPAYFGEKIKKLLELGVSIIGGCCGTTPHHVRSMRQTVNGCRVAHENAGPLL